MTSQQKKMLNDFMAKLRKNPAGLAMFEASGHKRLLLGNCLFCDKKQVAGAGVFSARPGLMTFLEGRAIFYFVCPSHVARTPESVEDRIEVLHRDEAP